MQSSSKKAAPSGISIAAGDTWDYQHDIESTKSKVFYDFVVLFQGNGEKDKYKSGSSMWKSKIDQLIDMMPEDVFNSSCKLLNDDEGEYWFTSVNRKFPWPGSGHVYLAHAPLFLMSENALHNLHEKRELKSCVISRS